MASVAQFKSSPVMGVMVDTLAATLRDQPAGPGDHLERLTQYVQGTGLPAAERVAPAVKLADPSGQAEKYINQVAPPPKVPEKDENGDDIIEEPEEDKGTLPDIWAEGRLFRQAGVSFDDAELYRVMIAMKTLLQKEPLASVRLWGKIFGTQGDYVIVEAEVDPERVEEAGEEEGGEEEEDGVKPTAIFDTLNKPYKAKPRPKIAAEAKGTGANKYVYYVFLSGDSTTWVLLPDVQPEWILAARLVQSFFTGSLDVQVPCHPPFPGLEKQYLRAQIARISHCTSVCPRDMFTCDAQQEEEDDEDEPKKPKPYKLECAEEVAEVTARTADDVPDPEDEDPATKALFMWAEGYKADALLSTGNWVHAQPELTKTQGRAAWFKPEEEEDEEAEVEEDDEVEKPPPFVERVNPRLSDLAHDRNLKFTTHSEQRHPAWSLRKVFHLPGSITALYSAKSHTWPGAVTLAQTTEGVPGAFTSTLYIGSGIKRGLSASTFSPQLPEGIQSEYTGQQTAGLLQVDATPDDEHVFDPPVVAAPREGEDEEEEEEEDE